jgi:hypothetical protein
LLSVHAGTLSKIGSRTAPNHRKRRTIGDLLGLNPRSLAAVLPTAAKRECRC